MENRITTDISDLLADVRHKSSLVHHITNYVTVNDCANITLAIGSSPIMADDIDEAADITAMSAALVLNIGTLNKTTITSMIASGKKANELNIPVILDPVGVGASMLRNQTVDTMLEQIRFSVIRGNMSEIRYIAGLSATTKGVDTSETDRINDLVHSIEIARLCADKYNCTVAITGATDIIAQGTRAFYIENGHKMLSRVTGTGCMCTSLIGSFCSVTSDYLLAAAAGVLSMAIAGEMAIETVGQQGSGTYHTAIIDEISKLTRETLCRRAKIYEA